MTVPTIRQCRHCTVPPVDSGDSCAFCAPLFSVVDLVTGLGHLRQASVLIDRVAESLDAEAVSR